MEDERDRRSRGPIYAIELREQGNGADVAIVRIPRDPIPAGASEDV